MALRSFDYYSALNQETNSFILKDIIIERNKSKLQVNDANEEYGSYPFFTSGETILYIDKRLTTGFNIYISTGGNAKVQAYYGDAAYSTDTWCITANDSFKFYLYGYLKHIESQMDKLFFHGTGLRHLQKPLFLESKMNVPNDQLLTIFNKIVSPIYKQISNIQRFTFSLKNIKQILLPLLINQQLV